MIYLIQVEYKKLTLLKIGYTKDTNKENRFTAYKMHNPLSEILFTIPEGTERHEKALHFKFRKYLYKEYGNEWFNYNEEIIDFFKTHTTKESLNKDLITKPKVHEKDLAKLHKEINRLVNRWLCLDSTDIKRLNYNYSRAKDIIEDCRKVIRKDILDISDILPYLIEKYNISKELQKEIITINNSDIINQFLYEFNSLKDFPSRMKFLCTEELSEQERGVILDQIPLMYKNYYETLGSERCKANGYIKTTIDREYKDIQFNKGDLKNKIKDLFNISKKYTKSDIKETLRKTYEDLGYNKSPKAIDLEEYFELKECKVLNSDTGKWEHGFEIIKRKD